MNKKIYPSVKVITDYPHPTKSLDYTNPAGSIEDNSTFTYFIYELDAFKSGLPYRLLDIGSAGGQFVVDIYNKGYPWVAVGLEGGNIHGMTEDFESAELGTGTYTRARGSDNWLRYENKCLFHADVSKPFKIVNEREQHIKFDIVTAWEFFEHPEPEDIPNIIDNIVEHIIPGGIVLGTINACIDGVDGHHRCAKPRDWWDETFASKGFRAHRYPFRTSPRTNLSFLGTLIERMSNGQEGENGTFTVDNEVHPHNTDQYAVCYQYEGD